jgi:CBS domain-containing protein
MHLVSDHMTTPAVTIRTSTTLAEILRIFDRGVLSALPVVDEEERLVGVVSTSDVVRRLTKPLDVEMRAKELMSTPSIVANPAEQLEHAACRLVAAHAHRLIVVENDHAIGVLSVDDVLGGLLHRQVPAPLRTIMSEPVESVLLGAPISEAVERLGSAGVHGLVVVDGLSPVGIFDQNEALAARRLPPSLLDDPVEQIMCHDVITLSASTPIHRAARYAWSTKARRILVRENEELVGIVSDLDLVDSLSRAAENKAAAS